MDRRAEYGHHQRTLRAQAADGGGDRLDSTDRAGPDDNVSLAQLNLMPGTHTCTVVIDP